VKLASYPEPVKSHQDHFCNWSAWTYLLLACYWFSEFACFDLSNLSCLASQLAWGWDHRGLSIIDIDVLHFVKIWGH